MSREREGKRINIPKGCLNRSECGGNNLYFLFGFCKFCVVITLAKRTPAVLSTRFTCRHARAISTSSFFVRGSGAVRIIWTLRATTSFDRRKHLLHTTRFTSNSNMQLIVNVTYFGSLLAFPVVVFPEVEKVRVGLDVVLRRQLRVR